MAVRTVAVIPARGGSKGIPGKNLQAVGGRSLVERAVLAAKGAKGVDLVVVSSDSKAILAAAEAAGAKGIERPAAIAGDTASSEAALLHAIETLAKQKIKPDVLVFLQATSPFTSSADVEGCLAAIRDGADSAFTATPTHAFLWRTGAQGAFGVNHDAARRPRRQDREAEFIENGAVYAMRVAGFLKAKHRFFGRVALHAVPASAEKALEIDDPHELQHARLLATGMPPLRGVKLLVLDFDGVLTDDKVTVHEDGHESVRCSRADGLGLEMLRHAGVEAIIVSKERNPVVAQRAKKLKLECLQSQDDKPTAVAKLLKARKLAWSDLAYVGNDLNDLECIQKAGHGIAVADARREVRAAAAATTLAKGGHGAVREVCDAILAGL